MNEHEQIETLLPLYAAGQLEPKQNAFVERHLATCKVCQEDLILWTQVAGEIVSANTRITPPPALPRRALIRAHLHKSGTQHWRSALLILRSQLVLIRRDLWPAAALVMTLGYIITILARNITLIPILAPLVAASSLAMIYGEENDPAIELTLSTPTSPRQILLARLTLVFGYDLLIMLIVSLATLPVVPGVILNQLIVSWLGPMTFLSGAALVLSLRVGTNSAITLTYIAWILQWIGRSILSSPLGSGIAVQPVLALYNSFWQNPQLLILFGILLTVAGVWIVGRKDFRLIHPVSPTY